MKSLQESSTEIQSLASSSEDKIFGNRLRSVRTARARTQAEIARIAGMQPSYLSGVERGLRPAPAAHVVDKLAVALKLSAAETAELQEQASVERARWQSSASDAAASRLSSVAGSDHLRDCLERALEAMRQGWCTRIEVIAPGKGQPLRLMMWRAANSSQPLEAAM